MNSATDQSKTEEQVGRKVGRPSGTTNALPNTTAKRTYIEITDATEMCRRNDGASEEEIRRTAYISIHSCRSTVSSEDGDGYCNCKSPGDTDEP